MKKRITCVLLVLVLLLGQLVPGAAAADMGYAVSAAQDMELGVGEDFTVHIRVTDARTGVSTYNAYDLELEYDLARLEFLSGSCRDFGATVEEEDGRIRVIGYGANKSLSTPVVALRFRTKAAGTAQVTIARACVDAGSNAITQDAPEARIADAETVINILPSYTVTLDAGLSADSLVAEAGEDYTFRATDPQNYTYDPRAIVGGREVDVIDNGDGTYTIPGAAITGPVTVRSGRTPKSYTVTLIGDDVSGEKSASYNTAYEFKLTKQTGYTYTVAVTIGGKTYTGYTVKSNIYTIPGTDITGNIIIKVTSRKTTTGTSTGTGTTTRKTTVSVSFVGSGAQDASGSKSGKTNTDYVFKLDKQEGYTYDISVQVGGREVDYTYDAEKDTYTIPGRSITGDVTVVITKSILAELYEYLTLDGASIYLVVYGREVEQGQVPRFDGQNMFWSDRYNAYVWLISSDMDGNSLQEALEPLITLGAGQAAGAVSYSGNVNLSTKTDVNDLQLAYDMYNGIYRLGEMEMIKFLNADVNSDKRVDVRDSAAIMFRILTGQ